MSNAGPKTLHRKVGIVAGFLVLAAIPAVGLGAFAAADTTSGEAGTQGPPGRPALTDAQRQCLADQGVTLPGRPADGTRPAPPTDEQRAALRAAAEACGLPVPAHGPRPALTDAQRQCLADQGVTLPGRPADGTRPAPPTDEERAALRAAAEACGLPVPAHGPRPALTDAQRQCLADQGVTLPGRPADGTRPAPPTDEQRAALRAAAEACGISIPSRGSQAQSGETI